jgi:hypothetical protein
MIMAEQKTAQQQVREQYKVAESTAQNVFRAWSDVAAATTELTFETFQKNLNYAQELRSQADRAAVEALATYQRVYQESMKAWQGYIQGVNEIVNRSF